MHNVHWIHYVKWIQSFGLSLSALVLLSSCSTTEQIPVYLTEDVKIQTESIKKTYTDRSRLLLYLYLDSQNQELSQGVNLALQGNWDNAIVKWQAASATKSRDSCVKKANLAVAYFQKGETGHSNRLMGEIILKCDLPQLEHNFRMIAKPVEN